MKVRNENLLKFGLFLLGLALLIYVFAYVIEPAEILESIGVRNSFLILFIFAFFGGLSTITAVPFYGLLTTFFAGGLDPLTTALVVGPGLLFGNSVMYYLGHVLQKTFTDDFQFKIKKFYKWLEKKKITSWIPGFILVYFSVMPISPDPILIFLASIKYPYKNMVIPMLFGEIIFIYLFGIAVQYGFSLL
jgi:membrane protein YqaA with SNARE-associated domain